ncbi:MAG TPA: LysR family transcriptional regulator [Candidatus Limnocylindria bacterium]|nr:LysR family transcriptional regulator [Candidatus Limnocylindria bacterium]
MIDCKDIDYVLTIAKHRNISAAARELFITQPALTKYLKSVEARIGILLFDRTKHRMTPTLAGERYIAYAAEISGVRNRMGRELSRIKSEKNETLKIAFSSTGFRTVLFEAIGRLRAEEPSIQLDAIELRTPEVERMLVDYQADLGFISLPARAPELHTELYFEENVLLCVPSGNPLVALGKTIPDSRYQWIDLSLFRSEPFVRRSPDTRFRTLTDRMMAEAGNTEPNIVFISRNQFTSIEFAEQAQVCCFLPESYIQTIRRPGAFHYFLTGTSLAKMTVGMAHLASVPLTIPARRFLRIVNGIIDRRREQPA